MNTMNSRQRKLVYTLGIVVLLVPIILLGLPKGKEKNIMVGKLATLRTEHKLGEDTLGDVDPSSAAMNLILLGLRGVATDLLHMKAIKFQEQKKWGELRDTVGSVILLQPHYLNVWRFQGWNLAWNVSSEWDQVEDRYYWVKEGGKFYQQGINQNITYTELYWDKGNLLGKKIGRADEWRHFRKFFLKDPDTERWEGGADKDLNPDEQDNYLVAKKAYFEANDRDRDRRQHIMDPVLFRHYPYRSQFNYARALQKEGRFGEICRKAWEDAHEIWTSKYGFEIFKTPGGYIQMEANKEQLTSLLKKDEEELKDVPNVTIGIDEKLKWQNSYRDRVHYRYWRTLGLAEKDSNTDKAHQLIYQGQKMCRSAKYVPLYYRLTDLGEVALQSDKGTSQELELLKFIADANAKGNSVTRADLSEAGFKGKEYDDVIDTVLEKNGTQRKIYRVTEGQLVLEQGLKRYAVMLEKYPNLKNENATVEEAMNAILEWRDNFAFNDIEFPNGTHMPNKIPLKSLYEANKELIPELEFQLRIDRISRNN